MFTSPHCHPESSLTGSTLENMCKRAKDLGRKYFTHTDQGSLSSAMKSYSQAKKMGLKAILGIEFYFKDEKCPIVSGTKANRCRYFSGTVYARDQEAYQELCRQVSRTDLPTLEIFDQSQSLWNWSILEKLSKLNISLVLGGIHCMVGKNLLAGEPRVGLNVFNRLKELFGEKLSVALLCEPWSKKYANVIKIEYKDGSSDSMLSNEYVSTDKARKIKVSDLIERPGHTRIESKISGMVFSKVRKEIHNITSHKGFLPLPGNDASLSLNKFLYSLAKRTNTQILATDYAYYAEPGDRVVQDMVLEGSTKMHSRLHMKTEEEIRTYLSSVMALSEEEVGQVIDNTNKWAESFDKFELKYGWRLPDSGGDPVKQMMGIIKKNGRMRWDDPVCVDRLKEEISVIAKNGTKDLTGYFLPICDVMTFYKENGHLTGPARGSAAGSYLCYLLGITQVDSIKIGLSFPRFLSLDRIKNGDFPDVDSDFSSRDLLVGKDGHSGYLYGRWGDKAAQISTRHTVRLKSAIKDANRYFNGSVEQEIEALSKALPDPPQGVSDRHYVFGYKDSDGNPVPGLIEIDESLKNYSEKRPKEWAIVQKALGITRAHSQHASAFVISDVPISEVMPTKEGHITQYEAKAVEAARLLKYDFLVVNNLKDIEVCLNLINKKNNENLTIGNFTHNGKVEYIWDLPEDEKVFESVWGGETQTLFQINTKSMIPFVRGIRPKSVEDLSTILALVRPGPMDFIEETTGRNMAEEYVLRRQGKSEPNFKELYDLIPETEGVIVYQEQCLKISKELGGMAPSDAEKLRRLFSKKQKKEAGDMKPLFMSTAIPKIGEEKANKIWDMMETSSRYSFNRSHSYSYAMISYAGMFLRHHYPLEWWAAILTNATEKEITEDLWPYVKDIVAPPDINLSGDTMVIDYKNGKIRSKLGVIRGIGDATIIPIVENRPYKDIQDFVNKGVSGNSLSRKLIHVGVLDSLFPPRISFLEQLKLFENAVENKKYFEKAEEAKEKGKTLKALQPKEGKLPEEYINLHPFQDAAMKKSVLPTLPIDLYGISKVHSKYLVSYDKKPKVMSTNGYETFLVDGRNLQRLDSVPGENVQNDVYVASTCFVIEAKEFSYPKKNPTKKALKLILDSDGYISEKVLWPDYNTGQLNYPKELKKGAIATFFFRKRRGRKDINIMEVKIES